MSGYYVLLRILSPSMASPPLPDFQSPEATAHQQPP